MTSPHYRPFTLVKKGELSALRRLTPGVQDALTPVFFVASRDWNYETEDFAKSLQDHYAPLPAKMQNAREGRGAYIDISLVDSDDVIFDVYHPIEWLVFEANSLGYELIPMNQPGQSASHTDAVRRIEKKHQFGVGVRLRPDQWTTVDPRALTDLLAVLQIPATDIDLFVDVEASFGPLITASLMNELTHIESSYSFRSITVGGAGFPATSSIPRGVSEFPRDDWALYVDIHARRDELGLRIPDFFDNLVLDPQSIELAIDPRFISISGTFRYTNDDLWLFAKGLLFKGQGTNSKGGAALIPALEALVTHPGYGSPISTQTDDWIRSVLDDGVSPGNPATWREWASARHFEVVTHQLATAV